MDINQILAGGFIGAVIQQVIVFAKDYLTFKREKTKILFQNKLVRGERLVSLYSAIYFNIRTVLAAFGEAKAMLLDLDLDMDHENLALTLTSAEATIKNLEEQVMTEGTSAYLYYDISNTHWTDVEFHAMFLLSSRLQPKMEQFNRYILGPLDSPELVAIRLSILQDIDKMIDGFTKYQLAINVTIGQLKEQSK